MEQETGRRMMTIDANEATASVAHRLSEIIAIYPITPSSPMGEHADEWSVKGNKNIWGTVPQVSQMQSEAGVAGTIHGSLQTGALATTFTASQGLLLMIPNMYKIAGELTSFTMHVTGRTVATHALSIFGDHSDVMACRQTGFAMLASNSVQESQDMAAIAHSASLKASIPFMHFFDGFRTSHEINKIEVLTDDDLRLMIDEETINCHRQRALTPDRPVIRGTAYNPDAYFQGREAANPYYLKCPEIVKECMEKFGTLTGRHYGLFEYVGHPEAQRIIIIMGSGAETVHETTEWLINQGEKVGLIKVRLFRPFSIPDFASALPESVKAIAVLDRTKEAGALGEPLYQDIVTACQEDERLRLRAPVIIGGRYGLSSKEFDPAMVKAVFDELQHDQPKKHFTIGIEDDVTHLSLSFDREFDIEADDVKRCLFYGLGADGTVGANKNSIKIIGEDTPNYGQGYFVYDSKKSGSITVSHLRFGPRPIRSTYLIKHADFVGCHQFAFLERVPVLENIVPGGIFLLNAPYEPKEVWQHLPREVQETILTKELRFYVIDAYEVARHTGMGVRINTIMQTCFFAISGIFPQEEAISHIKESIRKTYGKKGEEIVRKNFQAVDDTLANLHEVQVTGEADSDIQMRPSVPPEAPDFVKEVTAFLMAGKGDLLPVSAFPPDGTWPLGTTKWEKRNIALEVPIWDPAVCIQCGKCSFVCPHATIRTKVYDASLLEKAPESFRSVDARGEFKGRKFTVQLAPEDCTGCRLCVMVCPAKSKSSPKHKAINMQSHDKWLDIERRNYDFFLSLPEKDREELKINVKNSQLLQPLFEYSGCCAGCGETQNIKLLTQLFGDRTLIANSTGCSSIYGGNLPTTPYTLNKEGRGPAWSNSLFEDNAEFGFGFRLALDKHKEQAIELLKSLAGQLGDNLVDALVSNPMNDESSIKKQRKVIEELRGRLAHLDTQTARRLEKLADYLVKKDVWIVGGDGWAYDIGFGGLDHVLSQNRDVNVLVLDTEIYSNTGGQQSKATPLAASAKFAAAGKASPKKDLGLMMMTYGFVYVAQIAFGANDNHAVKVFKEAESYPGSSLIIAYSHCIGQGYDLAYGASQQKLAVESGSWPLYRFDPRRLVKGENPFQLDSGPPKIDLKDYIYNETRFRMLEKINPDRAAKLLQSAQENVRQRRSLYEQLANIKL